MLAPQVSPRPHRHRSASCRKRCSDAYWTRRSTRKPSAPAAINDLNAELATADQASNELRGENEELYDKFQESQRLIRFLREQLQEAGRFTVAHTSAVAADITYPTTFSDLLDRLGELPGISFTGNHKITRSLDSQSVDNWLYVAWGGLLAPNHFARCSANGTASDDFLSWCKSDASSAFPFPAAKVAMRGSDTVARNPGLRGERMLPIPKAVSPDRRNLHAGPPEGRRRNTIAPRLHFYDDCPRSGKVYVERV